MNLNEKLCNISEKKAIFFDIDGTLHSPMVGIPASAKEGIRRLKENGHLVFVCTGRSKAMLLEELKSMEFDGIIAGAGTYVEYDGRELYRYDMDEEETMNISLKLREFGLIPVPEGHDIFYIEEESRWTKEYKKVYDHFYYNVGGKVETMPPGDKGIKAAKISAVISEGSDLDGAREYFEGEYLVVSHGNIILELIPKGFSKAEGIRLILEKIGISKENTYGFGDSMNDYEMLDYVNYGVAMGNSDERLMSVASYVTDTVENDGVYKALEKLELI